jgi:hypothetical protein
MQNVVGIDSNGHQRVMLSFRHREDQPMRDNQAPVMEIFPDEFRRRDHSTLDVAR